MFFGVFALISILIIMVAYSRGQFEIVDLGKEAYRFLMLPVLVFTYSLLWPETYRLSKFALILIKLSILYTLYEFTYLNIFHFGDFNGLLFYKAISHYHNPSSSGQYFTLVNQYGIPFFRPFGLWLQPQSSSFIFPLGILLIYLNSSKKKLFCSEFAWYLLFTIATFIAGGKTAFLAAVTLLLFIALDLKNIFHIITGISLSVIGIFIFVIALQLEVMEKVIVTDINAAINLTSMQLAFGTGFIHSNILLSQNFSSESFIIRFIVQIGIVLSFIYFGMWGRISLFDKINKTDILIIIFMAFAMSHYSIMSNHFIMVVTALVLIQNNQQKKAMIRYG
jgi:hypothetical protein